LELTIINLVIVQKVHYKQSKTNAYKKSAARTSYRATAQSNEIISLISDS